MARVRNTKADGTGFSQKIVDAVWRKGKANARYDRKLYRMDSFGAWMQKSPYGICDKFGWEIDHIKPVAKGGSDELTNLQPLYWENNRSKGDEWPD